MTTAKDELDKALNADLSSLEHRRIVTICTEKDDANALLYDKDGNAIVVIVPENVPENEWEKAFQLFLITMQSVPSDYRIVYVHSGFDSHFRVAWWLARLHQRVPQALRKSLKAVSVVHPTVVLRLLFMFCKPFVSSKFWDKLHYVDRIDELFLDEVLPAEAVRRVLPPFVFAYERKLLEDGTIAREMAAQAGAPLINLPN